MIDLHCHYLPGIDDGAQTMAEALDLARAAVADGITEAAMTPHVHPGRYENTVSSLRPLFLEYRQALAEAQIPLAIHLAGEVRLLPESLELLTHAEMPILGTWQEEFVALIEFPHEQVPVGAMNAVAFLRRRGIRPLLAHPERNKDVMRDWRKLEPFVKENCLLQVTAASVCGLFGDTAQKVAHQLIEMDWVTVVASDAHSVANRPPVMSLARQHLAQRYGEELAVRLTQTNPAQVVAGNFTA